MSNNLHFAAFACFWCVPCLLLSFPLKAVSLSLTLFWCFWLVLLFEFEAPHLPITSIHTAAQSHHGTMSTVKNYMLRGVLAQKMLNNIHLQSQYPPCSVQSQLIINSGISSWGNINRKMSCLISVKPTLHFHFSLQAVVSSLTLKLFSFCDSCAVHTWACHFLRSESLGTQRGVVTSPVTAGWSNVRFGWRGCRLSPTQPRLSGWRRRRGWGGCSSWCSGASCTRVAQTHRNQMTENEL